MTEQTKDDNAVEMAETRTPAEIKRDPIVVQDENLMLDTGRFEMMQRVALAMSEARLVPKHLQKSPADCLLVVNQALKRGMDPLDLAQHTFVVSGKLGYEGKVVAAWINASSDIEGRLRYNYEGEGEQRKVTVIGKMADEEEPREITGTVADWKTNNENWKKNPDSMLAYRGAREWARRHVPEILLGVYTPDELETGEYGPEHAKDITPAKPERSQYKYASLPTGETVDTDTGEVVKEPEPATETETASETDGGGDGEPQPQKKGETVVTDGEADGGAAPAPAAEGNGDPTTWGAAKWGAWAKQALVDIDDFVDLNGLDEFYNVHLDAAVKINLDKHRNEGATVQNRYLERMRDLEEAATAGADA